MTTPTTLLTAHPPNPKLRLEPISASEKNLQGLKRLNSLLLPVNYGEKFYRDITANPDVDGALTRVALWDGGIGVVGGVRGRYEVSSSSSSSSTTPSSQPSPLPPPNSISATAEPSDAPRRPPPNGKAYIMTLGTLAPFRSLGVATALLEHVVTTAKEWDADEVYAHVWEENWEALDWYRKRGFEEGEIVKGYYRRLRPDGAMIVRLRLK